MNAIKPSERKAAFFNAKPVERVMIHHHVDEIADLINALNADGHIKDAELLTQSIVKLVWERDKVDAKCTVEYLLQLPHPPKINVDDLKEFCENHAVEWSIFKEI